MAGTGLVNGMYFDPEVFTDYMQEQSTFADAIIASGILVSDDTVKNAIGASSSVGTMPIFKSFDGDDEALNFDGDENNVPQEIDGKKQSFMKIGRMRAWKDKDFTRYLVGKSPLENLANNLVVPYWRHQWQKTLLSTMNGVMSATGLENHITDLTAEGDTPSDSNKISETSLITLGQKALGDMANNFSLVFMHSAVYARLKTLGLVNYDKYTISGAITREITLSTVNGKIVQIDDSLVDTSGTLPVYHTYLAGRGAFLTADCEIPEPYYTKYDPETNGGVHKLYTKQSKILHPNGMSLKFDNIVKESPTNAELANSANWELVFEHKNVPIALLKTNG